MQNANEVDSRLNEIRLVVFDFDGVMTNNRVYVSQDGVEMVACNRLDGLGIGLIRKHLPELSMMIVSTEKNPVVSMRAKKLQLECHQGVPKKLSFLESYCSEKGLSSKDVAYVGNDLNDFEAMSWVALPICPSDAVAQIREISRIRLSKAGGEGCVRELCDQILFSRGVQPKW